jgi:hypothetical protein
MGERNVETRLLTLQSLVIDAIRLSSPISGNEKLAFRVEQLVAPGEQGMPAAQRLDIYREQFWLRHLSNLRDDYPTLAWAVGEHAFERLAIDFLGAFPPRTWDLQQLGADLPGYVASHSQWEGDAIVCGAARLDWAFIEAYVANDAHPFDPRLLLSVPEHAWPLAHVLLHPSLHLVSLGHPLHRVRSAIKDGSAPQRPSAESTRIVVWRDAQYVLRTTVVDSFAFALLSELERGAPLGEACESVAHAEKISADTGAMSDRVAASFQEWTANGWVTSISFTP